MQRQRKDRAAHPTTDPSAGGDYLFVGFNRRVAALDRLTGELKWQWKASAGTGLVSVLVDRDIVFASVSGYTYALDPVTGRQLWSNALPGLGTGIPCLATLHQSTALQSGAGAAEHARIDDAGGAAASTSYTAGG